MKYKNILFLNKINLIIFNATVTEKRVNFFTISFIADSKMYKR